MLDVTRLRVLVAVARHGSVTAAARSLNYAQPSVSHHLARLEAETGTQLTERSGRGVRLTAAGRLLAERAEEILGRLEAAETELAAQVGQRARRVRLAAFPSALATIAADAAARLRAEHPRTDLSLIQAEPAQAVQLLRAGQVDVALACRYLQDGEVVYQPGQPADGTRTQLVLTEPVLVVTSVAGAAPSPAPAAGQPALTGRPQLASEPQPAARPQLATGPQLAAGPQLPAGPQLATGPQLPAGAQLPSDPQLPAGPRRAAGPQVTVGPQRAGRPQLAGRHPLAAHARGCWIGGGGDSQGYLLWACQQAGFTPKVTVTTSDHLAAQALVAAGMGAAVLPELALRAARHPGVAAEPLPGATRQVLALTYGERPHPPAVADLLAVLCLADSPSSTGVIR